MNLATLIENLWIFFNISWICIYPDCWTVRTWSGSRWWRPVVPTSGTLAVDLLERPQNLTDIVKSTTWYHESSPDMLQQTWLPLFSMMWRPQLAPLFIKAWLPAEEQQVFLQWQEQKNIPLMCKLDKHRNNLQFKINKGKSVADCCIMS